MIVALGAWSHAGPEGFADLGVAGGEMVVFRGKMPGEGEREAVARGVLQVVGEGEDGVFHGVRGDDAGVVAAQIGPGEAAFEKHAGLPFGDFVQGFGSFHAQQTHRVLPVVIEFQTAHFIFPVSKRWTKTPRLTHDDAPGMSGITSRKCTMAELNAASAEEFVRRVGGIFEHSPWIAEAVASGRPFAGVDDLLYAMGGVVRNSPAEKQFALIQAHPDLAGRLAQQGRLTAESSREQAAAGLTAAGAAAIARIRELNTAYRSRFGFPFIICARQNNAQTIVAAMEQRLKNEPAGEPAAALEEIFKIARLRLADIVGG